ncbi:MAG TPA: hypothetical protein VME43_05870, partial [Bryobacteraceae bacterium]|nr:hypothetical protein [Bryobacteraceae bacterium]
IAGIADGSESVRPAPFRLPPPSRPSVPGVFLAAIHPVAPLIDSRGRAQIDWFAASDVLHHFFRV